MAMNDRSSNGNTAEGPAKYRSALGRFAELVKGDADLNSLESSYSDIVDVIKNYGLIGREDVRERLVTLKDYMKSRRAEEADKLKKERVAKDEAEMLQREKSVKDEVALDRGTTTILERRKVLSNYLEGDSIVPDVLKSLLDEYTRAVAEYENLDLGNPAVKKRDSFLSGMYEELEHLEKVFEKLKERVAEKSAVQIGSKTLSEQPAPQEPAPKQEPKTEKEVQPRAKEIQPAEMSVTEKIRKRLELMRLRNKGEITFEELKEATAAYKLR